MATKSQKTKAPQKVVKKATEKLEISLRKKIKDFVLSLGHDAEEIGDEIKKTSKILAKRLNRKLKEAKNTIDKNVAKVKTSKKSAVKKAEAKADKVVEKAKKETKKFARKAASVKAVDVLPALKKEIKKEVKKATSIAKSAVKRDIPSKTVANKPTVSKKKPTVKDDPIINNTNAHPETPAPKRRQSVSKTIPKSDTKPHNKDLPLEAGPRNKYKRG